MPALAMPLYVMTLQSDLSRMLVIYVKEKRRRRAIRRGGAQRGTCSGSCVVPSDWEGQTAGQAAGVALMDLPFIDHSKINMP